MLLRPATLIRHIISTGAAEATSCGMSSQRYLSPQMFWFTNDAEVADNFIYIQEKKQGFGVVAAMHLSFRNEQPLPGANNRTKFRLFGVFNQLTEESKLYLVQLSTACKSPGFSSALTAR